VRDWTVNDGAAFHAESARLLNAIDPPATLLQLSLAGISGLTDRIAVLGAIEDDLGHRLRYLDPRTDDLVGRPSEEDLATLAVEGMLGAAAVRLNSQIETGGPEGQLAKRALERLFVEYSRGVKA
jgi:hypothetical protein